MGHKSSAVAAVGQLDENGGEQKWHVVIDRFDDSDGPACSAIVIIVNAQFALLGRTRPEEIECAEGELLQPFPRKKLRLRLARCGEERGRKGRRELSVRAARQRRLFDIL